MPPMAMGLHILQVRYETHLSDKVHCSEASQFSITKIWYAYLGENKYVTNNVSMNASVTPIHLKLFSFQSLRG